MTGGGPGSTNVPYFVYQESIGGGFATARRPRTPSSSSSSRSSSRRFVAGASGLLKTRSARDRRTRRGTRLGVGESRAGVVMLGAGSLGDRHALDLSRRLEVLTSFKTEQDASAQTLHHSLTLVATATSATRRRGHCHLRRRSRTRCHRAGLDRPRDAARSAAVRLRSARAEVA